MHRVTIFWVGSIPVSSLPPLPSPYQRRLAVAVALTGLVGGAVGAGYLLILRVLADVLGPAERAAVPQIAVLAAVGVAIALLVRWVGPADDVELLVGNIHVRGGAAEVRGLRSLLPASLLGVAAGGALGPEAPLVTTTGTLGSVLGRRAGLDVRHVRVVAITGLAAGFAVLFGAPLGSAVFALEILHRRGMEYYEALMPAIVGALSGYVVALGAGVVGLRPVWRFPTVVEVAPVDLGWAVVAGVAGALVAVAFTHLVVALRWLVAVVPAGARPALGGVAMGLLALVSPYALTNGEVQVEELVGHRAVVGTLVLAALVKLVASAVALVTGWRGGFIIPLLFVGFCLGRATAGHLPGGGHSWVLVAGLMVACNVGVTKTPLGSALVVTEMAGLGVLPTTLVAAVVSLVLTSGVGLIDTQRRRLAVDEDGVDPGVRDLEATALARQSATGIARASG